MSKSVICVSPEASIAELASILYNNGIHALPVIDKKRKLVGVVTETDLFARSMPVIHLPTYIGLLNKAKLKAKLDPRKKRELDFLLEAKARDVMTKKVITVDPETSFQSLIRLFDKKKIYSIPVIDTNQKIKGMVSVADVIKTLGEVNK